MKTGAKCLKCEMLVILFFVLGQVGQIVAVNMKKFLR